MKNMQITKRLKSLFISQPMDYEYLTIAMLLLGIGLIMLLSSSFPSALYEKKDPYFFARKQAIIAAGGVVTMLVMSKVDYHILRYFAKALLIASIILLAIVLIPNPHVSHLANNSRRWLEIGGFSFQPSEMAKLAIVIDFAASIARKKEKMKTFRYGILPYAGKLCVVCGLILCETHLSATIIILLIGAAMMYTGGIKKRYIILALCFAAFIAWLFLTKRISYGQGRIETWLNPFDKEQDEGYQLSQSLIAIGSGGLFGLGLGKSRQKHLFLPEEHNDFIFAVACEELGLVGATIIMLVFSMLIIRGYTIARNAKDRFGALLAVGITTHFAVQTTLNIAVVTGAVPTTGVSLPFFSYGGTAILFQLVEVGIVLSVSRQCSGKYLPDRNQ